MKVSAYTGKSPVARTDKLYLVDESTNPASSKNTTVDEVLKLAESSQDVFNVIEYGAVGDNTTDDTAAIQAAIDAASTAGGGIVWFPAATYKVTAALNLKSYVSLQGIGDSFVAGKGSVIHQTSTTLHTLYYTSASAGLTNVRIHDLRLAGPASGSGHGIYLKTAGAGKPHVNISLKNITAYGFGGYGVNVEQLIASSWERITTISCTNGFRVNGDAAGSNSYNSVNTSLTLTACYADGCQAGIGFNISYSTYITLNSCAADSCGTAYLIDHCNNVVLNAPGCEWGNPDTASPGDGYKITGSHQVALINPYTFQNYHYSFWITGSSTNVTLIGPSENTPVAATSSLKTDAGSYSTVVGIDTTTARADAGTTTYLNDGTGGMVVPGTGGGYFSHHVDSVLGYKFNSTAPAGHVLRGNGTYFVDAALAAADLSNGVTGSGAVVLATSPTLVTPALGTPSAAVLTNATGLPISTGVSGLGTGVATALAVNTGSAGAIVLFNGALGTPSSGTLTNATGLPISTGVSGLGTGIATFLATPSSANLATAITDETGSGALVFGTTPTLATPVINGLPTGTGIASAATASTLAARDSNANLTANNLFDGFTTTATAAATTTLTVASTPIQVFTGSTTQTVKLPTTGVPAGAQYIIINQSTGAVTVQSSGANTITILAPGTSGIFTAVVATPTTAANWNGQYFGLIATSGKSLSLSNTLTLAGTDGTTMTFPGTNATIARTDAAQTFTGVQTLSSSPVLSSGAVTVSGNTVTFPTTADTLVARATTDTLTNKRITKRDTTTTQSATPTINTDNTDHAHITGLAQAITSMTTNLTGTPVAGDTLWIDITDNGTARAITWGTSFEASGNVALPTTTVISTRLDVGFVWNEVTSKWRCVAVA